MSMEPVRNRFRPGSGVYTCVCCGKHTRETGDGESDARLCAKCNYEGLMENTICDGEQCCSYCGNVDNFDILFEKRHLRCNQCGATGCYDSWVPEGVENNHTFH